MGYTDAAPAPERTAMTSQSRSQAEYNIEVHVPKGLVGWRSLYVRILGQTRPQSVIEIGSGSPEFLQALDTVRRRTAIDGGDRWKQAFLDSGIEFYKVDLDTDTFPALPRFDVSICSDVFEHLLYPARTLSFIRQVTADDGFLLSHVPNEFRLGRTLKIMLGRREAKYSHRHCEEYDHPHLRRFSKIGYEKFLAREFKYNLFLSDLRYGRSARLIDRLGLRVPYALEGGPTFASTNDESRFNDLRALKRALS